MTPIEKQHADALGMPAEQVNKDSGEIFGCTGPLPQSSANATTRQTLQSPSPYYQLFELIDREHGKALLESELAEIVDVVCKLGVPFVRAFEAMSRQAHFTARKSGFWDARDKVQNLCDAHGLGEVARKMIDSQLRDLMVSELGEACEGARKNLMSEKLPGFTNEEEEYADLIIRLGDKCAARGLRVAEAVVAKMAYNPTRGHMHDGKAF